VHLANVPRHIGGRKCDLQPGGDAVLVHLVHVVHPDRHPDALVAFFVSLLLKRGGVRAAAAASLRPLTKEDAWFLTRSNRNRAKRRRRSPVPQFLPSPLLKPRERTGDVGHVQYRSQTSDFHNRSRITLGGPRDWPTVAKWVGPPDPSSRGPAPDFDPPHAQLTYLLCGARFCCSDAIRFDEGSGRCRSAVDAVWRRCCISVGTGFPGLPTRLESPLQRRTGDGRVRLPERAYVPRPGWLFQLRQPTTRFTWLDFEAFAGRSVQRRPGDDRIGLPDTTRFRARQLITPASANNLPRWVRIRISLRLQGCPATTAR